MGVADPPLLDYLALILGETLHCDVRLDPGHLDPAPFYDPMRRQYESTRIVGFLAKKFGDPQEKVLGVAEVDLFIPILTFVFGEAELNGRAAVVSTARLAGHEGVPVEPSLLAARLVKECVHELGHTFGLIHCRAAGCAMARSASLRDVDAKTGRLCPECRERADDALSKEARHHEPKEHAHPDR